MKGTIKAGLTRTYALRQYENIKPMIEIECEYDTEDKKFDMKAILGSLKRQCEEYISQFDPRRETENDGPLPF